jgi:hypothetical protein
MGPPDRSPLELRQTSPDRPNQLAKVRVAQLAARQFGRVTHRQLKWLGVTSSTAHDWRRAGFLHPRLPGVHAVGHPGRTVATELFEAVLYAGPGAMLSHTTAAWWQGLIDHPTPLIHVSTPRRRVAPPGIMIHGRRQLTRVMHKSIPVTTPEQTVFDLATYCIDDPVLARVALAQLDFRRPLRPRGTTGALPARHRRQRTAARRDRRVRPPLRGNKEPIRTRLDRLLRADRHPQSPTRSTSSSTGSGPTTSTSPSG